MQKLAVTLVVALAAALTLAACGSSSSSSSSSNTSSGGGGGGGGGGATSTKSTAAGGGGGSTVSISAAPSQLAYQQTSASAKAGNVTVNFNNPDSAIGHDVCIEDSSGKLLGCTSIVTGSTTSKTFSNLKAGSYTFYCSVDSHRQAGMQGKLNVQ